MSVEDEGAPQQPAPKSPTDTEATLLREPAATTLRSSEASAEGPADTTHLRDADATLPTAAAAPPSVARTDTSNQTTLYRGETVTQATDGRPTPATSSTAKIIAEDSRVAADLEVGAILKDRFVIESVLGRGGMGVVYRALDLRKQEAQDRFPYVALKALSHSYQRDEKMIISLQRESQKAQSLAHPNIATVYDFDRQGSLVYLTMEVLTGSPLDDFIKTQPDGLPRTRVVPILRGLCLGLAYAHNKGIVHSDFKPGNVFLGTNDNPKILDFGIARAAPVAHTQTHTTPLSADTQFDAGELGALTPAFAAKEMFLGADPHPSDDVYALAVTVYQMLTGRHPFANKPAPQAEAEGLRPAPITGLKRREWHAIRRGLAFERKDRQQHAAEFLRDFEGKSKLRLVSALAAALAVMLTVYFTFVQVQERARIAPDQPFETLDTQIQAQLTRHLADGQAFQRFGDYAGALTEYRSAYQLHPRNPQAVAALIELMTSLRDLAVASPQADVTRNLLTNLDDLMATDDFLERHAALQQIRSDLEDTL